MTNAVPGPVEHAGIDLDQLRSEIAAVLAGPETGIGEELARLEMLHQRLAEALSTIDRA